MKTLYVSLVTLVVLAGGAANATAQTCLGNVAISSASPLSAGPVFDSGTGSRTITGVVNGGSDMFFLNGTVGRTSYTDTGGSSTNFSVTGAGQLAAGGRLKACPFVTFTRSSGPNDGDVFQFHSNQVGAGAAVGFIAAQSGGMEIVPNASLVFNTYKGTAEFLGVSDSQSTHYSILGLGVGFVFSQRFSLQPIVYFPMGLDGADPSLEIAAFFAFGGR